MTNSGAVISYRRYYYRQLWATAIDIYRLLARRDDLGRLVRWATAKRLVKPRRLYQNRLEDVDMKLNRHRLHSPTLTFWVSSIFTLLWLITPPRCYYPKGSAAQYKTRVMVG